MKEQKERVTYINELFQCHGDAQAAIDGDWQVVLPAPQLNF